MVPNAFSAYVCLHTCIHAHIHEKQWNTVNNCYQGKNIYIKRLHTRVPPPSILFQTFTQNGLHISDELKNKLEELCLLMLWVLFHPLCMLLTHSS